MIGTGHMTVAGFVHTVFTWLLIGLLAAGLLIVALMVLHRWFTILRWREGGINIDNLARCKCGRQITKCLHDWGGSGWEHRDGTALHEDGTPAMHR